MTYPNALAALLIFFTGVAAGVFVVWLAYVVGMKRVPWNMRADFIRTYAVQLGLVDEARDVAFIGFRPVGFCDCGAPLEELAKFERQEESPDDR